MLRTKAQRKSLCTSCPVARAADLLGDSCSLLIIRDLLKGPARFRDIERSLGGISTRTLTHKLRQLEHGGFVARKEFREKPPRVVYSVTPKGKALRGIIESLRKYGEKYL